MRLAALTALFVLICCVAPSAGADEEKLPAQLAGIGSTTPEPGKKTTAPWSISISSQDADGNLKGTLNWNGRTCQISAVPFTGTYRNGVLDISAPATSRTCGAITMMLTKASGTELVLEGTGRFHGSETPAAVNLRPR
ncbi:MAG TPA: hypothetical protein VGP14_02505 [Casimicrobiaceae bacterium]|jgi:hypothetical protein|nr:hypothetical protein [Casimicrobiaceae bacterium]